jgi:5-methylcytosine-specific restriction protein B
LPGGNPVRDVPRFAEILRDDIVPLLEEYCYEDFEALERILGSTLVQKAKQRVDVGLFEPTRHMDLIQALLSAFEGITATKQAVEADAAPSLEDEEDDGEAEAPQGPAA